MSNKSFSSKPFQKLKKQIESVQTTSAPQPSPSKKKTEYTDEELFSSAMDDVRAIEAFRTLSCVQYHPKPETSVVRPDPDRQVHEILSEITEGQRLINLPDTPEYVEWVNPAHQETITSKLHQGTFSVQAYLDLHGFTVPEAEAEMEIFLQEAFTKGMSCVKIIHGRGLRSPDGPRIKETVIRRLSGRHRKRVIAFVSARQCDGGLGAVYVLLTKR